MVREEFIGTVPRLKKLTPANTLCKKDDSTSVRQLVEYVPHEQFIQMQSAKLHKYKINLKLGLPSKINEIDH